MEEEMALALAPLSSWETTTVLTKGKGYSSETAGINIKLKYPVVLKIAAHHKHSLLL